jgi:glutamate decarboxylase
MPDNATDIAVLRVVVREGFSRDMAEMLLADIKKAVAHFEANPMSKPKDSGGHFAH